MRKKEFNELPEVIEVLGIDYNLTETHKQKLQNIENEFGRIRSANAKSVAHFIKYDLDNWNERLSEIKTLKNTITVKRYILLMGEIAGTKYWENISTKKKDSQTEISYITKYGEKEGKRIWKEMNKKRGVSAFSMEYWIKKGLTQEEAEKKISTLSKKGSLVGNKKQQFQRENDYEGWAKKMPNTKYYWMEQGYSEEESLEKVTNRQTTFSKEICIEKYGEKEGLQRWMTRQEKWMLTLDSKTAEEKFEIYKKKIINNFEIGKASKESVLCLQPILDYLKKNDITYYFGEKNNKEFYIFAYDRYWLYDLTIPSLKLCFEYNGEAFHPNPKWKNDNIDKWEEWEQVYKRINAPTKRLLDKKKISLMKEIHNFDVFELWSSDSIDENREITLNLINERLEII